MEDNFEKFGTIERQKFGKWIQEKIDKDKYDYQFTPEKGFDSNDVYLTIKDKKKLIRYDYLIEIKVRTKLYQTLSCK